MHAVELISYSATTTQRHLHLSRCPPPLYTCDGTHLEHAQSTRPGSEKHTVGMKRGRRGGAVIKISNSARETLTHNSVAVSVDIKWFISSFIYLFIYSLVITNKYQYTFTSTEYCLLYFIHDPVLSTSLIYI